MSDSVHKSRILIVDDEPINLQVLSDVLKSDYKLFVAKDGDKAVEIALREKPDLILMDVLMPKMDGISACETIKSEEALADLPVIFVTSLDDVGDEEIGFSAGGCDYIIKPIIPSIVKARVKIHLENYLLKQYMELMLAGTLDKLDDAREEARKLKARIN